MVMPRARAVLSLITRSYFDACSTGRSAGSVTGIAKRRNQPGAAWKSGGHRRRPPLLQGRGSEAAEGLAGDEMTLEVEGVVDGGVAREEVLRRTR
jgi:hypothetical protein